MEIKKLQNQRAKIVLRELKKMFPEARTVLNFSNDWELIVAVALSAQTTDKQVNVVTSTLFKKYPKLIDYVNANHEEFTQDVSSVNYYKNKAKYILAAAQMLHNDFNGAVPKTVKELMKLPGVGRKTANVVLGNAHGLVEGIAVDTHVQRLAQKFGLTENATPEKIEKDLMEILPRDEWFDFTNRIIDYGRSYSPAHKKDRTDPICVLLDTM